MDFTGTFVMRGCVARMASPQAAHRNMPFAPNGLPRRAGMSQQPLQAADRGVVELPVQLRKLASSVFRNSTLSGPPG